MSATIGSIIQFPTCPEHLTPDQVEQYHRDGFLAFTDVLSPDEVEQLKADPEVAKHFKIGELEKLCSLDFHFKQVNSRFKKLGL